MNLLRIIAALSENHLLRRSWGLEVQGPLPHFPPSQPEWCAFLGMARVEAFAKGGARVPTGEGNRIMDEPCRVGRKETCEAV